VEGSKEKLANCTRKKKEGIKLSVTLSSTAPLSITKNHKFRIIEGIALTPGTFQGIDGKKIKYPNDVVEQLPPLLRSAIAVDGHTDKVIGFVTDAWLQGNDVGAKVMVFDEDYDLGKDPAYSIEAELLYDDASGENIARLLESVKKIAVLNEQAPACEKCKVTTVQERVVQLGKENSTMVDEIVEAKDEGKEETKVAPAPPAKTEVSTPEDKQVPTAPNVSVQLASLSEKLDGFMNAFGKRLDAIESERKSSQDMTLKAKLAEFGEEYKLPAYIEKLSHAEKMAYLNDHAPVKKAAVKQAKDIKAAEKASKNDPNKVALNTWGIDTKEFLGEEL
jgi:hypothetical protein